MEYLCDWSTYVTFDFAGSANPVFGAREAADAIRMADEVQSLVLKHADGYITRMGCEAHVSTFS
jgi:hypothetical protein